MSFKNRLMSKIPASYILHKSSNKTEAKLKDIMRFVKITCLMMNFT